MSLFAGSHRSKWNSTVLTALVLAFSFALGLAGGVAYRLMPATKAPTATAPRATTAPAVAPRTVTPMAPRAETAPPATAHAKLPTSDVEVTPPAVLPPAAPVAPAGRPPALAVATPAPRQENPSPVTAASPTTPAEKPSLAPKPMAATAQINAAPTSTPPPKRAASTQAVKPETTTSNEGGSVLIQFGAYAVEENARLTRAEIEAAGLHVLVTHEQNASGRMLYYVRSQPFTSRAAALAAAVAVKEKAQRQANADPVRYVILAAPTKAN